MRLVKFPSINQFKTVIKSVKDTAKWHQIPVPTLKFHGTVKSHGTNAGVLRTVSTGETWCQSRENIITVEKDNAGFATFIYKFSKLELDTLFNVALGVYGPNNIKNDDIIAIYGEWCGQGIQKGVAVSQLPKMFMIFGIRIIDTKEVDVEEDLENPEIKITPIAPTWFSHEQLKLVSDRYKMEMATNPQVMFSVDFPTWEIDIDFTNPQNAQNTLSDYTIAVETECPIGKHFGVSGIGEGIVWKCCDTWTKDGLIKLSTSSLIFKVKGEKHSVSKVKTLVPIDIEKVNKLNDLVAMILTENRMEQIYTTMCLTANTDTLCSDQTGAFIKACVNDCIKEETDTIIGNGFELKDFTKNAPNIARQFFMNRI